MVLLASYPHCTWAVAAAAAGVAIPAAEDQEALAADALRGLDDDRKNRWKWVEGGMFLIADWLTRTLVIRWLKVRITGHREGCAIGS